MKGIQMVDLKSQYEKIKDEVNQGIQRVIDDTAFINGKEVKCFSNELADYTGAKFVVPCANGTDALQIAMMGLGLKPGDEVIVPAFTYVATVEVIALLGLKPVFVEVNPSTFTVEVSEMEKAITGSTKAIVPVHLYGQCADMEAILTLANKHSLYVIEDAAQAIGASYTFSDGSSKQAGTMGDIGTTSFFPSKNLGCFGDGGAMFTNDEILAERLNMIANHGQKRKYYHDIVGVNSRLDTLQAAILRVKLKHLKTYELNRQRSAEYYDTHLLNVSQVEIPARDNKSTHVFHQYTLKIKGGMRDSLKEYLESKGVPTMIYYPLPQHLQQAYSSYAKKGDYPISENLCENVLSLPIHTEMQLDHQTYIVNCIKAFFKSN